jgi:hypothetical protein
MNSMLSMGLITCLMIPPSPLLAEEKAEMPAPVNVQQATTGGPIANAIASEAVRFDAERSPRPPHQAHAARTWSRTATGALIGFGAGAALGMTIGQEACLNEPRWHCAKVGVPFAAVGAVIAWLHR